MTNSELLSFLSISYCYSFLLLLSPPPELSFVLVLQVRSYLKFYSVARRIDIFIALLHDQQHEKKFPVHTTIQHSFSPSSVQAPTGYQSSSWNKISMAVPEAKQLHFLFLQEPNVSVLHLAKGSCREIM